MMDIRFEIDLVSQKKWGWDVHVKSLEDENDNFYVQLDKHWFLPGKGLSSFMIKRAVTKYLRERFEQNINERKFIGEKLFN